VRSLDRVFDTPSGMPYYAIDPATCVHCCRSLAISFHKPQLNDRGMQIGPKIGILAEIATLQLEYTYLAKLTGEIEHFNRVCWDT